MCCVLLGMTHGVGEVITDKTEKEVRGTEIECVMGKLAFGGTGILSHCAKEGKQCIQVSL